MGDVPFIDTHVHFWEFGAPDLTYSWLAPGTTNDLLGSLDGLNSQRYLPHEFEAESRFHNVSKVVHVQAALGTLDPVVETRWLQVFADELGVPHGIVAYADLTDPDVESTLARHAEFPNVRGIRDFRYDDYLTNGAWERGYALLERFDLVCCDDPAVEEMGAAAKVVGRQPGITYCVDHAGFPKRRDDDYFREWRAGLAKLAAVDNTVIKISGLGMADQRWTVETIRPWVTACIELWGTERAFFGTNWPVDRLFSGYGDVIDAYAEIVGEFTPDEQLALFFGNAKRTFRL